MRAVGLSKSAAWKIKSGRTRQSCPTIVGRFMTSFVRMENGCWQWPYTDANGYGRLTHRRVQRALLAHRVSYELFKGPIPTGLQIDHLCRNRACVNPDHLEAVTQAENIRRGMGPSAIAARRTHCWRGHAFTPENTRTLSGKRFCIACQKIRNDARPRSRARERAA